MENRDNKKIYDLVLFGATGYTGQYTAEHIATHLPTNLSWAVAGRSRERLLSLVQRISKENTSRKEPAVETVQLNVEDLQSLAAKTKVLVNCVGPYCVYGTPVVEACAHQGTHYLDATGEVPWVKEMIHKFHDLAKNNGAIIIPQNGVESAPADMMTFALTSLLRSTRGVTTDEVILTTHDLKGSASGGTLATIRQLFQTYSLRQIAAACSRAGICPIAVPKQVPTPAIQKYLGIRYVANLPGTLTTSFQSAVDTPLVYRSWGLLSSSGLEDPSTPPFVNNEATHDLPYGSNFKFNTYLTVSNALMGALLHVALVLAPLLLALRPVRWLMSKMVLQPGQGPTRQHTLNDRVEYRAVAIPDEQHASYKAYARLQFKGSLYHLTGIFLAEGAATILYERNLTANKLGGGVLTPAMLGLGYIERLSRAGVIIETEIRDV